MSFHRTNNLFCLLYEAVFGISAFWFIDMQKYKYYLRKNPLSTPIFPIFT